MKAAWLFLWRNRTMTMAVTQITLSEIARSGLVADKAQSWCLLGTGILTGCIALHNKIAEVRAEKRAKNAG
jgi:hypothetical protein